MRQSFAIADMKCTVTNFSFYNWYAKGQTPNSRSTSSAHSSVGLVSSSFVLQTR